MNAILKTKMLLYFAIAVVLVMCCFAVKIPATVEYLGSGYVQDYNGKCVVNINSVQYPIAQVYSLDNQKKIDVARGAAITAFRKDNSSQVEFILGKCDEKFLSSYFASPSIFIILMTIVLIVYMINDIFESYLPKRNVSYVD